MSVEYGKVFNRFFYPIMNAVEHKPYKPKHIVSEVKPKISYIGGLQINRWKMICQFAKCIDDIADVIVYTMSDITEEMAKAFDSAHITLGGFLKGKAEVNKALEDSDILLHVESDDFWYRRYTFLSVSTKIPEYLMSSRLTIGYGPIEVASMRIMSDHNVGIVISSDLSPSEVKSIICRALTDEKYRNNMILNAYTFASSEFDVDVVAHNFRCKMESIITD